MFLGRPLRFSLIWLTLLVYLMTGLGSAFGAVWCLSEGADCRLQSSGDACCSSAPTQGQAKKEAPTSLGVETCISCTDIVLTRTAIKARARSLRVPVAQELLRQAPFIPSFPMHELPGRAFAAGSVAQAPSPVLAQLSTVVLLN